MAMVMALAAVNVAAASARRALLPRGAPKRLASGAAADAVVRLNGLTTTSWGWCSPASPAASTTAFRGPGRHRPTNRHSFSSDSDKSSSSVDGVLITDNGGGSGGSDPDNAGEAAASIPEVAQGEKSDRGDNDQNVGGMERPTLPPLTEDSFEPCEILSRIRTASRFDQDSRRSESEPAGKWRERRWDYQYARAAVDDYERHLRYVLDRLESRGKDSEAGAEGAPDLHGLLGGVHPSPEKRRATHDLLSPDTLASAVRALTRTKVVPSVLSARVRDVERLVGAIGWTPINDELSYRLLEANGKAGNVRRTLALLELRRRRGYPPRDSKLVVDKWSKERNKREFYEAANRDGHDYDWGYQPLEGEKEFIHAITAIQAAQFPLRVARNIHLNESMRAESSLDNPTRYLDAILINMSQRGVRLRPKMAARMLACYSSSGRTGKAIHYFYRVVRDPVEEDGYYIPGPHPGSLGEEEYREWKDEKRRTGAGRFLSIPISEEREDDCDGVSNYRQHAPQAKQPAEKTKIRMVMHPPPLFHKIPSMVREKSFPLAGANIPAAESSSPPMSPSKEKKTKYEWEVEREWSLSLTAAFAFADSLTHGACGHQPIAIDVVGWNSLIKACCYRGAFHRAMRILDETMSQRGAEPNTVSYNTLLSGLSRVGDVVSIREYLTAMTNKGVKVRKLTVQAVADGFLNAGDVPGASTAVQDMFNQHDVLPPYVTHLKIIEHALACGLPFEAKRHVYFVQQLWKWTPSRHHSPRFVKEMELTKRNPKLSKGALQRLFRHFREDLTDDNFF